MTPEHRTLTLPVEHRQAQDATGTTMTGYAWVYGQWSRDLGGFVEQIAPDVRYEPHHGDVLALANHDRNLVLGRLSSGTLRLVPDARGMRYEVDMPDTTAGRDWAELLRRGDIAGSSFTFFADEDEWEERDGLVRRTLTRITVVDIGPVTVPAYPQAEAAMRSLEAWRTARTPATPPAPKRVPRRVVPAA
ncbi:HK97 family phage prohead protease [Crossiella sp. CA198]|uniref:HK97 family phage prohead protease n=1 Tax=Crossiella sp. CA198 TaxID=3455607 RepID=UPI003F8D187F